MPLDDYSRYQQGIIKRYYANADTIQLQRLSELVGDLYLAEGKKLEKLWATAQGAMEKAGVPASRIERIMSERKPELLANLVKELQGQ
jgi:hypothetical protein